MIVITGAFGFIGSCLVRRLNAMGVREIIVVDDFYEFRKEPNLERKWIREWIHRDIFLNWFRKSPSMVDFVFHLGARTDTTSTDKQAFDTLNFNYTREIWDVCTGNGIPLVYASSAATYGMGEHGFEDDHEIVSKLKPQNLYAQSKQDFDMWALKQEKTPPFWAGVKFFNVFGPNEYHKGRMASVVFHAFKQIRDTGKMKLFRSHKDGIEDGHQSRDFIYVKDAIDVCLFLMKEQPESGLYNCGTGQARTFLDLTRATFAAMDKAEQIEWIDTPADIRESYQYFTEADLDKLRGAGFTQEFTSLEDAVSEYVQEYLAKRAYY